MKWVEESNPAHFIRDVGFHIQEEQCVITWHWPAEIPFVYVHKSLPEQAFDLAQLSDTHLRLYTREEYKALGGYRETIEGIGRYAYRIFPGTLDNGAPVMLIQGNQDNVIVVNTGKTKIYYSIKQKKQLFGKYKSVQIHIFTELALPKDVLCYVKKEGAAPMRKEDGTQYAFINDFAPGRNILPEIEVKKNDYIRIFFTDGRKYGEIYELIPE